MFTLQDIQRITEMTNGYLAGKILEQLVIYLRSRSEEDLQSLLAVSRMAFMIEETNNGD